jgi:hypothetical protein
MSLLRTKLKMKNAKVQTGETGQRGDGRGARPLDPGKQMMISRSHHFWFVNVCLFNLAF